MNMVAMREGVEKLYLYDKWRTKVKKMSDAQVLAIYQRNRAKIEKLYKLPAGHYKTKPAQTGLDPANIKLNRRLPCDEPLIITEELLQSLRNNNE